MSGAAFGSPDGFFSGLGFLPGGDVSVARGISADGSMIVGFGSSDESWSEAFVWTFRDGMRRLAPMPPGWSSSWAEAVSGAGDAVVGMWRLDDNSVEGFLWTAQEGVNPLAVPDDVWHAMPTGVSDGGGRVVGVGVIGDGLGAVTWESGGVMTPIWGGSSLAEAVSRDGGRVAGWVRDSGHPRSPFGWDAPPAPLGQFLHAPQFGGSGIGVSDNGRFVVGYSNGLEPRSRAFAWSEADGLRALPGPGNEIEDTYGLDVSDDGIVAVGFRRTNPQGPSAVPKPVAVVWDARGAIKDLADLLASFGHDTAGWTLVTADGVSADGRTITGEGINPQGQREGWVAVLPRFDACGPADIAAPFGSVDMSDLLGFLHAFAERHPDADAAPPYGVFDAGDLQAFIGCMDECH